MRKLIFIFLIGILTSCHTIKYSYDEYNVYNPKQEEPVREITNVDGSIKVNSRRTKLTIKEGSKKSVLTITKWERRMFVDRNSFIIKATDGIDEFTFSLNYSVNLAFFTIYTDGKEFGKVIYTVEKERYRTPKGLFW